jgi:hypothetical protein
VPQNGVEGERGAKLKLDHYQAVMPGGIDFLPSKFEFFGPHEPVRITPPKAGQHAVEIVVMPCRDDT